MPGRARRPRWRVDCHRHGTVAFQIEGDKEYKVGGWGFPHGDEGSGAWLGLEAVRLTLHWLDGRGELLRSWSLCMPTSTTI